MRKLITPQIWEEALMEAARHPWQAASRSIRLKALSDLEEQGFAGARFSDFFPSRDLAKALRDASFDWTPNHYFYLNSADFEAITAEFGTQCWDCGERKLLNHTPRPVTPWDIDYCGKRLSTGFWYEMLGYAYVGKRYRYRSALSCGNCAIHGGMVRLNKELAREIRSEIRNEKELKICQKIQKNLKAMLRKPDRAVWPSLLTESIQAKTSLT